MRYKFILPYLTKLIYHTVNKHKLYANPKDLNDSPFFILGSGRNGSTLLSMILNNHSKIFIPPEQYALHYASIRFQLYNFLLWNDIVKLVIGEFADSKNSEGWNANFNDLYNKLNQMPIDKRSFQNIINEIVVEYASQKGQKFEIWGDKSPNTIWFIRYIYRAYPKSKFIFLLRDGRDVVSSYIEGGELSFGELANGKNAAINWKACIDKWKWLKKKALSEQLLEIRYENLVKEPEQTIKDILAFLHLPCEKDILQIDSVIESRRELEKPQHKNIFFPINTNSIGKWKQNLSEQQLSKILPIIGKELRDFGYL